MDQGVFYILKEAGNEGGQRLGSVGGRNVAPSAKKKGKAKAKKKTTKRRKKKQENWGRSSL